MWRHDCPNKPGYRVTIPCWTADNKIHIALHIWSRVGQRCSIDLRDHSVTIRQRVLGTYRLVGGREGTSVRGYVCYSTVYLTFRRPSPLSHYDFFLNRPMPTSIGRRWCTRLLDIRKCISELPTATYLSAYIYQHTRCHRPGRTGVPNSRNE